MLKVCQSDLQVAEGGNATKNAHQLTSDLFIREMFFFFFFFFLSTKKNVVIPLPTSVELMIE